MSARAYWYWGCALIIVAGLIAILAQAARADEPPPDYVPAEWLRACELQLDVAQRQLAGERAKVATATRAINLSVACPPIPECPPETSCLVPQVVTGGLSLLGGIVLGRYSAPQCPGTVVVR